MKRKITTVIVSALLLLAMCFSFVACGVDPEKNDDDTFKVTFDYNYTGSAATVVDVESGKTVARPDDPERDGWFFTDWYTDAACTAGREFDFGTAITAATTVYAGWLEDNGQYSRATFMYNYEGADTYRVVPFTTGEWIEKPEDPTRDGYVFDNWTADAAGTVIFNFNNRAEGNITLYAAWRKVFVFEAEYTDLDGKPGNGYSGNTSGTGLVFKDTYEANASNGFFVSCLYYNGAELEFVINAAADCNDVTVVFRLSSEFDDMIFTGDSLYLDVNGNKTNIVLSLTGAIDVTAGGENKKRPFTDHTVAANVGLIKGENIIKIVVNNDVKGSGGTMNASAPMVDCMYLYSNTELTWSPKTSNTAGK